MSAAPCRCGDRTRPHVNHRVRVPCWAYLGSERLDVGPDGRVMDGPPCVACGRRLAGGARPESMCDACLDGALEAMCGAERQGYYCLLPKGHQPPDVHASLDGGWQVLWSSDAPTGVKLRKL